MAQLDVVATEVAEACRQEIPGYGQLEIGQSSNEVRQAFREHAEVFIRGILEQRSLSAEELSQLAALGRRRFEQGLALHDLVAGYQIGVWLSLRHLVRALDSLALEPTEHALLVDETTRQALRIAWQASGAITRAHMNAQRSSDDAGLATYPDLAWLEDDIEDAIIERRLAAFGFALAPFHIACLIAPIDERDEDGNAYDIGAPLAVSLGPSKRNLLVGRIRNDVAILIGLDAADVRAAMIIRDGITTQFDLEGQQHRVVISKPKRGAAGIPRAFRQASRVMTLLREAPQLGSAMTFEEAMPFLVLRDAQSAAWETVEEVLGNVLADTNGPLLLETLEAYFACGCRSVAAAAALHVHRQTLYERLERIQALTGLNLEDGDARLRCQMALKAIELFSDPAQG